MTRTSFFRFLLASALLAFAAPGCSVFFDLDGIEPEDGEDLGIDGGDATGDGGETDADDTSEPDTDAGLDVDDADAGDDADAEAGDDADADTSTDTGGLDCGEPCGECGDGRIVCGQLGAECVGDSSVNECGGCGALIGPPEAPCSGACNGVVQCTEEGNSFCLGSGENACGGCLVLDQQPGFGCDADGTPDTVEGIVQCTGLETTGCFFPGQNACGGVDELPGRIGGPCGTCGLGQWACDGAGGLICENEDAGLNACGGCGTLDGAVGSDCGYCPGGELACNGTEALLCVEATRNICGGCTRLDAPAEALPGEACDGGVWACNGLDELSCTDGIANACGGTSVLADTPGDACGECLDGTVVCSSADETACVGSSPLNACGGCGTLAGEPGATCGAGNVWTCEAMRAVCAPDPGASICGGEASPEPAPGTPCGECNSGIYACASSGDVVECVGERTGTERLFYLDEDGDGFGSRDDEDPILACTPPPGRVASNTDCDDSDRFRFPGADELCNAQDDDCDGTQDNDVVERLFYRDADGDTYGDPNDVFGPACAPQSGYVPDATDCDDDARTVNPGAPEVCDGEDNNCNDVEDEGVGNLCGGCGELVPSPGLTCGPADLDVVECDGAEATRCSGETPAPDLEMRTLDASEVDATSATLNGSIETLVAGARDHGFCWIADFDGPCPDDRPCVPDVVLDECVALGAPQNSGAFSSVVDTLSPGQRYLVRAFMTDVGSVYYGDTVSFETPTAGVTDLAASDGTSLEAVTLSWTAPVGATRFDVLRDDIVIDSVGHDGSARVVQFVDESATAGGFPLPPATFSATSGGRTDGALFTWGDPLPGDVFPHRYSVTTSYGDSSTEPSAEDTGFRAAVVADAFQFEVGLFQAVLDVTAREYLPDSPLGSFESVVATATTDLAEVQLRCLVTGPNPGDEVSAVLLLLADGEEVARTESTSGFRGVGETLVEWERLEASPDGERFERIGVTGESAVDTSPPEDPTQYRCVASAEGALTLTSEPVDGGLAAPPALLTGAVSPPDDGVAIATPSVLTDGRPLQTSVGYCWGTEANPSLGGDATCIDLGLVRAGEELSIPLSPVVATTVYFGRVYAEHELGVVYGEDVSFGGLIPGPAVVNAADGESDTDVTVTWSDVEGAVSYDVLRDDVLIRTGLTDALGLIVVDDLAPTPPVPNSDDIELQASQGSTANGVALNWTAPSTAPGAAATYTVVANFADGSQSLPTSDTGFRAAVVVTGYEVYRDGDFAGIAGVSREFLDTEAPVGSYTAGMANASDGTSSTFVALTVSGEVFTPGVESDFWIVPTGDGFAGDPSVEATGFRAAPEVTYLWTFSDTGANGFYDPLGLTTREADDTTAPANGDERWYRLVTVLEPENQVSSADSGFLNVNLAGVETNPISGLVGRTATLNGDATSLGSPTPTDHGFCYGTSTAPALMDGSSTCVQLGALGSTGTFSTAVTDLPPAGTAFVRAFLTNTAGTAYGSAVAFSSQPDTPSDVTATQGEFIDRVVVTWSDVQGATSYRITSDSGIDEVVNVGDAFVDSDAPAGGRPTNIGLGLNASDGTAPDAVVLTWSLPEVQQGDPVTYTVVAVNEFAESLPSDPVTGWRTGPAVTAYQVRINNDDWLDVGDVTRFDHVDADAGMVTGAVAAATDGNAAASVGLSLTSIEVTDGETETYRVRALAGGAAGSASPPEDGFRAASQPSIQWERSITGTAGTFTSVSGATSASFADTTAPANGDVRFYRARLTQSNTFETNVDIGFRSAAPSVQTLDAVLGDAGIDVTWSLSALGGPAATAHGVCISTSPAPSLENGASCQSLADPAATGTFVTTFASLNAGTTYYARAFALNEVSTVYGAERTALTLPGAPTSVVATDGTRSDGVLITFTPGAGATSHALLRDGEVVATGISSGFVDNSAPAGGVPTGDMTVEAEGTASSVLLAWTEPSVPSASPSTFSVIPTNASGAGPVSSPDTGFRSGSPVQEYQVSVNGGAWVSTGATRSYTDTTAAAGQLIGGAADASDGTSSSFVSLNASGVAVGSGTASSYEVRAINVIGTGAPTPSVSGSRTAGTPTYQWQFGSAAGGPWNPLSGATALTFNDTSAPVNGDPRFYRLRVSATGSTTVFSAVDSGFRSANVPSVTTTGAAATGTSASLSGAIGALGTPAAFDHGFCYSSTVTNPSPSNATCESLGAPTATGAFVDTLTGLTRGTAYTVAAYAENAAGVALGGPLMFVTAPDAPTNLVANGTSSSIALSWDAAPSATTYVVQRNGVAIATVTATSYSDTSAPLPVTPGGSDVVITKTGVSSTSISLAFSLPSVLPDGASQTYRVVARNDAGDSPASGEAVGAVQGAPGIALWQIERDGVDYGASGAASFDDNDPSLAELVDLDLGATDGTRTDGVQVVAPDVGIDPRPHTYRVRAGAQNGVIGDWSEPFTTSVDVGALSFQWQRSNGDSPSGFVTVVTNGDDTVLDTTAPLNGRGRYYRTIVSAPGAETATSASDRGWRLPADCSAGPDEPDENNLDCDGDGIDGQIAGTIFVNLNSTAVGTPNGSFARPYLTIQDGLDEADGGNAPIYVAKGQYEESLFILDVSFDMWGGFSDGFLNHDPATFVSHIDSPNDRGLVYFGSDREALLDGFLITASDASTNASSIGLLVDDFDDLLFVSNCVIQAGDGRNGADGSDGADGFGGNNGAPGGNGGATDTAGSGGAPGVNICGTPGGFGGLGGRAGGTGEAGSSGTGASPNGRPGGLVVGGNGYSPTFTCSGFAGNGRQGNRGLNGEPGRPGLSVAAMRYGEVLGTLADWVGLDGPAGASGTAGGGGSGGGGGGGVSGPGCTNTGGNGGGGGGSGGCGADGGAGGEGGGGSIAIMASGGNAPALTSVVLITGSGGDGGNGGAGGDGGSGGEGGVGATGGTAQVGDGGNGGNGGAGGDGGSGAGGAGGMSVGFLLHNTNLSDAPIISTTLGTAGGGGAAGPTLFGLDPAPNGIRAAILNLDDVNQAAGSSCSSNNDCADGLCVTGICFALGMQPIEGDTFLMGAVPGDPDDLSNERPQHEVRISYDYFIGQYEMTVEDWRRYYGHNSTGFSCGSNCPLTQMTWYEALDVANRRSAAEGLTECYDLSVCTGTSWRGDLECDANLNVDLTCNGYRVPTEAEWEFVARSGLTNRYWGHGNDLAQLSLFAVYDSLVTNVGTLSANAFGVKDMAGNGPEWVWDEHDSYPSGSVVDPTGPVPNDGGAEHTIRGANAKANPEDMRSSARAGFNSDDDDGGVRLVRTVGTLGGM